MPMNKALRKKWKNAGYRKNMGSAEVVPPPPQKFIRVYHLTSAAFAINDIALRRLKIARILDLNDPFELMAFSFREKRIRKVVRNFKNAYDSHTGLLCFSADWTDPVLWSHYGAKHRGICLGFDLKRTRAQKIQYEDKRVPIEFDEQEGSRKLDKKLQRLLLQTKFVHWQYEEEHRVFVSLEKAFKEGSLHFFPFDKSLKLAEVILGPQCTLSLDTVRQLTQEHHPRAVTFKARLAFKFFKVVPDGRTVP